MDFDWTKPMIIDWTGRSGPLISEEDIKNSVLKRILRNQFHAPFCEREVVRVKPWWSPRDPFETNNGIIHTDKTERFIPGLHKAPVYPQLSALSRQQHQHGLRVLAAKNYVQPWDYPQPSQKDYNLFEEIKELYEKEQKEYIKWAKQSWINGDCIRALRPKPTIEQVYEAEFKMRANEILSLPQNYTLAAQIPLETGGPTQAFELEHKQDLINVDIQDLPILDYPAEMDSDFSILKPCPLPAPCAEHPCKFVLPYENSVSKLPLAEINYELAQYAIGNAVSFVASENALHCLLETERSWKIPVSVVEIIGPDGDLRNVTVLGNELGVQKECASQRTYKAYKHLLRHKFAPSTGQYKMKTSTQQTATSPPTSIKKRITQRLDSLDADLAVSSDDDNRLQIDEPGQKSDPNKVVVAEPIDSEPEIYECEPELNVSDGEPSSEPDRLMIDDSDTITEPRHYKPNYSKTTEARPSCSHNEADRPLSASKDGNVTEPCYNQDSYDPGYGNEARPSYSPNAHCSETDLFMNDDNDVSNQVPFYNKDSYEPDYSIDFKIRPSYSRSEVISDPDRLMIDDNDATEPRYNQDSYDLDYSRLSETYEDADPKLFETNKDAAPSLFEMNEDSASSFFKTNIKEPTSQTKTSALPKVYSNEPVTSEVSCQNTSILGPNQLSPIKPCKVSVRNLSISDAIVYNLTGMLIEPKPTLLSPTKAPRKRSISGANQISPVTEKISKDSLDLSPVKSRIVSAKQLNYGPCSGKRSVSVTNTENIKDPVENISEVSTKIPLKSYSRKLRICATSNVLVEANQKPSTSRNDDNRHAEVIEPIAVSPLKPCSKNSTSETSKNSAKKLFFFESLTSKPTTCDTDANRSQANGSKINKSEVDKHRNKRNKRLSEVIDQEHDHCITQPENPKTIENQSKTCDERSNRSQLSPGSNNSSPVKLTIDDTIVKPNCNETREPGVRRLSFNEAIPTTHSNNINDILYRKEDIENLRTNSPTKFNLTKSNTGKVNIRELFGDESDSDEPIYSIANKGVTSNKTICDNNREDNASNDFKMFASNDGFSNKNAYTHEDFVEPNTRNSRFTNPISDKLSNIEKSPLKPILRKHSFNYSSPRNSKRNLSFSDPEIMSFSEPDNEDAIAGFVNGIAVLASKPKKNAKDDQKENVIRTYSLRSRSKPKAKPATAAKKTTKPIKQSSAFTKTTLPKLNKQSKNSETFALGNQHISARLYTEDSDESDFSPCPRRISLDTGKIKQTKTENARLRRSRRRISARSHTDDNVDSDDSPCLSRISMDIGKPNTKANKLTETENVGLRSSPCISYTNDNDNPDYSHRSRRISIAANTRKPKKVTKTENISSRLNAADSDDSQINKTRKNYTDGLRRSNRLSTRSTKENVPPKTNQTKTNKKSLSLNTAKISKNHQNRRKSLPTNIFSNIVKLNQVIRSKSVTNLHEIANYKKIQRSSSKILSNSTKSLNTTDTNIVLELSERTKRYFRRAFNSVCSETDNSEGEISQRTKRYIRRSISSAHSGAERSDAELKTRSKKYTRRINSTFSYARNSKTKTEAHSTESINEDAVERTNGYSNRSNSSAYSSCEETGQPMPVRRKKKRQRKNINTERNHHNTNTMDSSSAMETAEINQSNTIQFKTEAMDITANQDEMVETHEININLFEETKYNIDETETIETSHSTKSNLNTHEERSIITEDLSFVNLQNNGNEGEFNILHFTAATEMDISGTESSDSENEMYICHSNTLDYINMFKNAINKTEEIDNVKTEIEEAEMPNLSQTKKCELIEENRPRTADVFFESANHSRTSNALLIADNKTKHQTILNKVSQPVEPILTDSALDFTRANVTDPNKSNEKTMSRKLSISESSDSSDYFFDTNETEELNMFHFTATNNTDSEEESEIKVTQTVDNSPSEDLDPPVISTTVDEKIQKTDRNKTHNTLNKTKNMTNEISQNINNSLYPSTSSKDLKSCHETLDTAALSQEAADNIIGVHNCTCKGTLFEVPPPRSFKKWQLRNITSNVNLNMIVHSSHKVRNGTKEVLLEPIVEYQPELGGAKQSSGKLRALALSLMLRESALLINVRVDHENGNVIVVDRMNGKQFVERHGDRRGQVADSLHTALNQLRFLMPGQYVLAHDSEHGANAMLYTTKGVSSAGAPRTLALRQDSINMPDTEEVIFAKIPPELGPALLPYHKHRSTLPLAFTPFKSQVREDKRAAAVALARAKHPPSGIQWPKKKKKSKKTRQRQSTRSSRSGFQ